MTTQESSLGSYVHQIFEDLATKYVRRNVDGVKRQHNPYATTMSLGTYRISRSPCH